MTTNTIPTAEITVYSKPACVQCTAVIRRLESKHGCVRGVDFVVVDITEDDEARDYVMGLGYLQAPVVVSASGDHFSGMRPDLVDAFVAALSSRAAEAVSA